MSDRFDIERRAKELIPDAPARCFIVERAAAIQLVRETAEAIAKEIATEIARAVPHEIRAHALNDAIGIARSYASPPEPETREKRLERALLNIKEELQQIEYSPGGLIERINNVLEDP